MAATAHWGTLGLIGGLVVAFFAASAISPPSGVTTSPAPSANREVAGLRLSLGGNRGPFSGTGVTALGSGRGPLTARRITAAFSTMRYDFDSVLNQGEPVPRVFLASLPQDLVNVREIKDRKAIFFQTVLPLILQVNEEILADRKRLWSLRYRSRMGETLSAQDRLWLAMMAERYETSRGDIGALLRRVDVIPPSLALAQAAEESGWGTSRFSREGNAIFGEWTFSEDRSLTPKDRKNGKLHRIRSFPSLLDSVRAYARNLNTHRAYRELRLFRASLRRHGAPLDGGVLARHLTSYSERGEKYVDTLQIIMDSNELRQLDDARLRDVVMESFI